MVELVTTSIKIDGQKFCQMLSVYAYDWVSRDFFIVSFPYTY